MSKKCVISLSGYMAFLAIIIVATYIFAGVNMALGVRVGVGLGAFAVLSVVGIIGHENIAACAFVLICDCVALGLAGSALFAVIGAPTIVHAAIMFGLFAAWYALYCLFTNIPFVKEKHTLCMIVWGLVAAGAAVLFALNTDSSAGWYAVCLLAPSELFFAWLALDAEDGDEHFRNCVLMAGAVVLLVFVVVMYFINSAGSLELPGFGSDSDDPYSFTE